MVINKIKLIFENAAEYRMKIWLINCRKQWMRGNKTKVIYRRSEIFTEDKKVPISVKPYNVFRYTLGMSYFLWWVLFPEKAIAAMRVCEINSYRSGVVRNIE